MTDQLLKALAYDGQLRVLVLDSTNVASEAQKRHDVWHTATAALGRTLAASLLLGANLKGDERYSIEVVGSGPTGKIVTESDAHGNVKGYIDNPHVALELNAHGKLDVAGAVGLPGSIVVRKVLHGKELFSGQVPLVSGELAEDFTYYMATSEQTASAIGLSVLVNADETVAASGGFMIQVMPGATDETLDAMEARINELGRFSDLLESQPSVEALLDLLVGEGNSTILEKIPVQFHCDCSKARFTRGLKSIGETELLTLADEDKGAEIVCHFCNDAYDFSEVDLRNIVSEIQQDKQNLSEA